MMSYSTTFGSTSVDMKQVIFLVVVAAAAAFPTDGIAEDYHRKIGINLAERIRQAEQAIDFDGQRITGGSPAPLGAHPYIGGLVITLRSGAVSVCGSSLLSNTRAITAAHCWFDGQSTAASFTVVLGSTYIFTGGVRVTTNQVVVHERYNANGIIDNDIAMIYMSHVPYTNVIRPISLPSGALLNENFVGWSAWASGYGLLGDGFTIQPNQFLSHVNLRVISNEECARSLSPVFIIDSTVCTSGLGGVGTCTSDSGGPVSVIVNGAPVLIGVVSFGSSFGCQIGLSSAHGRVTSFVPWIQSHLQ